LRPKTGNVVGSVVSNQWLILCRLPSLYSLQPQKVRRPWLPSEPHLGLGLGVEG